jgi:hypothetical protein
MPMSRLRCEYESTSCYTNLLGDGDYLPVLLQITFNTVHFFVDGNVLKGYKAWGIHVWSVSPTVIHNCPP